MRTTLDLPDDTLRRLKAQAALQGMKLKTLVTQYIERGLATGAEPAAPPTQRVRSAIPIARKADGSATPALSNAQLHALLEEQDLTQLHRVQPHPNAL